VTIQTLANVVIGLGILAWILYRQFTWQIVSAARMWRLPLIMGAVGVIMLSSTKDVRQINTVDVATLIIEVVISLAIGALMGSLAVFRSRSIQPGELPDPRARRHDGLRHSDLRAMREESDRVLNADGTQTIIETRTGWLGLALWIVMILVRIGIDVVATDLGSVLATTTGVILVMIAANRVARVGVLFARLQKSGAIAA